MPAVPPTTPNLGLPRFANDSSGEIWTHLNAITDVVDAIAGPWHEYTPVWSQSNGTVLQVLDGSLTGRYWDFGKTILVQIRLQRGPNSNQGSSGYYWNFTLPPVVPRTWNMLGGGFSMMRNEKYFGGGVIPVTATHISALAGDLGRVSNAVPAEPHLTGDWYSLQVVLERV